MPDMADYNAAFVAAPSPFADINNPTVAEINAVIASVNAINELVEDLNGDANATVLTLTELKAIQGHRRHHRCQHVWLQYRLRCGAKPIRRYQ